MKLLVDAFDLCQVRQADRFVNCFSAINCQHLNFFSAVT